ncbi:conserved hypothetical protein [Xenorhabdus bovienii str. Jollieti]|uniref:Uncharacterized protein n=1 Tax=Xenorhabdus bovienii (strain SS-2004) TaxID=406818 RepID=D3V5A7_XENBS|nr:conserved hypothetical protein [Xenorhabdus bovienii SS-2004]CDH28614.1 conserved hypothetical protein [Xenorhabdus bovienii str. Jollieti]
MFPVGTGINRYATFVPEFMLCVPRRYGDKPFAFFSWSVALACSP